MPGRRLRPGTGRGLPATAPDRRGPGEYAAGRAGSGAGCPKECRAGSRWSRVGCGRVGSVCRCPSCGFAGGLVEARGCIRAVEVASRNDASKQAATMQAATVQAATVAGSGQYVEGGRSAITPRVGSYWPGRRGSDCCPCVSPTGGVAGRPDTLRLSSHKRDYVPYTGGVRQFGSPLREGKTWKWKM